MIAEETYAVSRLVAAALGGALMLRRLLPRWLIPLTVAVFLLPACDDSANDVPSSTIDPTTTTALTTTTSAVAPTAASTSTQSEYGDGLDWYQHEYQSVGYSCGPDPAVGCGGDIDMSLFEVWVGDDYDRPVDFIDFYTKPQDNFNNRNADLLHEPGRADRHVFAESGWGLRVVQLDSPPAGLDVGGSAWLELTASSVSASEFSTREPQPSSASTATVSKHRAPTSSEPTVIHPPLGRGNLIEEIVLAETTSDMMQWIVVLRDPGTYHFTAGYFLGGPIGSGNGLQVLIRQD